MPKKLKIAIVGAGGQGKTTLVKRIVSDLKYERYDVGEVVEYARSYIEEYGGISEAWEQVLIFDGQYERERLAVENYDIVVCDITCWVSLVYSVLYLDLDNKKHRGLMAWLFKKTLDIITTYDMCFYLPKVLKVETDKVRRKWNDDLGATDDAIDHNVDTVDIKVKAFMDLMAIKYILVEDANFEKRVVFVKDEIKKLMGKVESKNENE